MAAHRHSKLARFHEPHRERCTPTKSSSIAAGHRRRSGCGPFGWFLRRASVHSGRARGDPRGVGASRCGYKDGFLGKRRAKAGREHQLRSSPQPDGRDAWINLSIDSGMKSNYAGTDQQEEPRGKRNLACPRRSPKRRTCHQSARIVLGGPGANLLPRDDDEHLQRRRACDQRGGHAGIMGDAAGLGSQRRPPLRRGGLSHDEEGVARTTTLNTSSATKGGTVRRT